jgi:small multidrug resistance pump
MVSRTPREVLLMSRSRLDLLPVVAIVIELIATRASARSHGFTRLRPTLVALVGDAVAFWMIFHALRFVPTGVAFGIWSGLGIVLIAAVA